jgi:hypothetical protein
LPEAEQKLSKLNDMIKESEHSLKASAAKDGHDGIDLLEEFCFSCEVIKGSIQICF